MYCIYTISVVLVLTVSQAYGNIVSSLHNLGLSPGTQIGPSSNFTQRWSSYDAPSYIVAVKPVTESDVAKVVAYAANSSVPFLTTGGGHAFAITLGNLHNGIELDLSGFNSVSVNADANTLTIGAAVRFRDILGPLGQAKKELPIESENCVGMIGATLGGGVGRYNALHGVLLDSLLSVKMVTAAGHVITASTAENSDLFWGIRGAGFNFGTILEATYSIYDETAPLVLNADFLFAANASQTILEYFKSLEDGLPAKLSLVLLAAYSAELGSFIIVNAVYAGPQSEAQQYLQALFAASPIRSNLTMIPWSSINAVSLFGNEPANFSCPTNSPHNVYGGAVSHFDIPTFQSFYENYANISSSLPVALNGTVYFIEFFAKQAVSAVPVNATAYPWRNITAHLLFNFAYQDTPGGMLDRQINAFGQAARSNFTSASGFPQPEIYVSYGHGDEDLATLYSAENLPRLRALKAQWDPKNVYRFNYPLLP